MLALVLQISKNLCSGRKGCTPGDVQHTNPEDGDGICTLLERHLETDNERDAYACDADVYRETTQDDTRPHNEL
jgi:hypothetical protein